MSKKLAASMYQVDMEPGDFFIFPFTLLHSVNPFNGTDEIRRTLSFNCNISRYTVFDLVMNSWRENDGDKRPIYDRTEKEN